MNNSNFRAPRIDQFRYIKIQANTIDLSTRLWGINPTNSLYFSCIRVLSIAYVLCSLGLFMLKTEGQKVQTELLTEKLQK